MEEVANDAGRCVLLLDVLVSSPEATPLFHPESTEVLKEHLLSQQQLTQLVAKLAPLRTTLGPPASLLPSWNEYPYRWQVVFLILDDYLATAPQPAGQEEEEEEEPEPQEEEEEADDEEAEDDEAVSAKKMGKLIQALKDDYSYTTDILSIWEVLRQRTIVSRVVVVSVSASSKTIALLERIKKGIKAVFDMLGLKGVLIGTSRLMKRAKPIEVIVRFIGTILVVTIFLAFIVGYPIYRFIKNPLRFFKWLLEDVEIDVPEVE